MTKYYIRTFDCGEIQGDDFTDNHFLEEYSGTFLRVAEDKMVLQTSPSINYQTFSIYASVHYDPFVTIALTPKHYSFDRTLTRTYWSILDGFYGTYFYRDSNYGSDWSAQGWTNPDVNYSNWLSELCTFFDTAKVATASLYGTDDDEVNIYILKWYLGNTRYYPIFKKGNDSHYDQIIET